MIQDDPMTTNNRRGAGTFAMAGKNSRTTRVFINYGDNSDLDDQYAPAFGFVEEGTDVADRFYSGYGDRPAQDQIHPERTAYLDEYFPKMDRIRRASILGEES
jgi:peptidyl-prolyl cis-trans isomerase A (cyclophilin A)